jgi:hypothetical protein
LNSLQKILKHFDLNFDKSKKTKEKKHNDNKISSLKTRNSRNDKITIKKGRAKKKDINQIIIFLALPFFIVILSFLEFLVFNEEILLSLCFFSFVFFDLSKFKSKCFRIF